MSERGRTRAGTPLGAVVSYAEGDIHWRPFMPVTEVARLSGVSYNTLLKWLVTERLPDGRRLDDAVCVGKMGHRFIRTDAFKLWQRGELGAVAGPIPENVVPLKASS
jgi:hypothetical protein